MKKVLIVMPSLNNGGAERSLVNLLSEFSCNEYEIDLLLLKKTGMFLKQVPSYVNIIDTPLDIRTLYSSMKDSNKMFFFKVISNIISIIFTKNPRERRSFRWKYFYSKKIKKIEKKYDIALAYISGEVLYLVDEKVEADKKIVWIHNDYKSAKHPKKYDYIHLKNMSNIVSISDSCVDILKEEFPEFKDKIIMLENITSSKVLRERSKDFYPNEYDKDIFTILSIGRLNEQKGFDIAVNAAQILKKMNIKFKWFIIGIGEMEKKLCKMIKANNLENEVILLGARENPYPYIKNCDLLVQPSRYEGKSVVLDEAKILGVPILVTNYSTVSDQIVNEKEGIIVPIDAKEIANAIKKITKDTSIRNTLMEYLNKKDYGNEKEIEKYYDLLEK